MEDFIIMLSKENKGITLVALVITIVILLILAGISISALTNTGIFQKAKDAKKKSEEATKKNKVYYMDMKMNLVNIHLMIDGMEK